MDLNQAATQLYAGSREDFVTQRTELAKQARSAGDRDLAKRIAELHKPTVGAWVVNRLSRDPDSHMGALIELGGRLRTAQFELDTAAMRTLGSERRKLVATLVRHARRIAEEAGISAGAGLVRDVEETLTAAVADESAGRAVASGQLTRTLQYSGFGDVDLEAATATPDPNAPDTEATDTETTDTETTGPEATGPEPTGPEPTEPEPEPTESEAAGPEAAESEPKGPEVAQDIPAEQATQRAEARHALFEATEQYGRAELEHAAAQAQVRDARDALERLQAELGELIERIDRARDTMSTADARAHDASTALARATDALSAARTHADSG